ncbi:type IV pilus modification protein PilV [Marinobacter sp. NFXS9]
MIEILVAVLVLAVGLLGVAGLQALSLRNATSVHFDQQAQSYADDIINRIMANRDAATSGDYAATPPTSEPSTNCSTETCGASQTATWDLWQWNEALTSDVGAPPQAVGNVDWNNATGEYTISITWDAANLGATYVAPTCTAADNTSAGCYFTAYRVR